MWAGAALAITYTCFFEIIKRAGGLFFAHINYVIVAAGLFWSWALYGEALSIWVWAAVVLLVVSLALMNAGTARSIKEKEKAKS